MSAFKVGDRVRTRKATRHWMIEAGVIGVVVEVRNDESMLSGVTVEFMKKPHPAIAAALCMDPSKEEPFRCLFPLSSVSRQIEIVK